MAPRKKSTKTVKSSETTKAKSSTQPVTSRPSVSDIRTLTTNVGSSSRSSVLGQMKNSEQTESPNSGRPATLYKDAQSTVTLSDIMGSSISTSDSNSTDLSNRSRIYEENGSIEEPSGSTNRGSYNQISNTTNENPEVQPTNSANTKQATTAKPKKNRRKLSQPSDIKMLKDMLHLQGTVHHLIPKLSFGRLIREILSDISPTGLKVTPLTLECLQEAAELYTVLLLQDSYRCTFHRDRVTLLPKDIQLALMLRREL